jgi:hypothetical protein
MKLIYPNEFKVNKQLTIRLGDDIDIKSRGDYLNQFAYMYYAGIFLILIVSVYTFHWGGLFFAAIFLFFSEKRFSNGSYLMKILSSRNRICLK